MASPERELDTVPEDPWDPLAPTHYANEDPEQVVDEAAPPPTDSPLASGNPSTQSPGDGGFSDPMRVARVWVDQDQVVRVRISSNWKHKVAQEKLSLADCVTGAIITAWANQPAPQHADLLPEVDESELRDFTSFDDAQRAIDELNERFDEAFAQHQASSGASAPETRGHAHGTTVVLDDTGRVTRVEFSDSWLDRAETSTINSSVVMAAQDAYRKFEPVHTAQDLQSLVHQQNVVRASFAAWIDKGDWK